VCRADEFTINTLRVKGSRALVLLALKNVTITTLLDLSGGANVPGPGGISLYDSASPYDGGVGGSFASVGGRTNGHTAAATYGTASLVPLHGGMSGKAGGNAGGGGGGALQITAGARIDVLGEINAGGAGGSGGSAAIASAGGGGGGSGGGVLLEAPTVIVSGVVVANGGGGGGGGGTSGAGTAGYSGGTAGAPRDPLLAAWGGTGHDGAGCPLYGYVMGGDGGEGAAGSIGAGLGEASDLDDTCIGSTSFVGGGGGGGGLGRIRINTTTGCQCGGRISPQPSFGTVDKQ
jgi:hypothetical protein